VHFEEVEPSLSLFFTHVNAGILYRFAGKVVAMSAVKVTFRAPPALLEELKHELKKRGVRLKGGQNKELIEALKLKISCLKGDVMKVYVDRNPATLLDIRDITPELLLEHTCAVFPVLEENFRKDQMMYFADMMLDIARKHGGEIHLIAREGNVFYFVPADISKLTPAALVENTKVKEDSGPHLYVGDKVISLSSKGFGSA
jgi:hypothetical protein